MNEPKKRPNGDEQRVLLAEVLERMGFKCETIIEGEEGWTYRDAMTDSVFCVTVKALGTYPGWEDQPFFHGSSYVNIHSEAGALLLEEEDDYRPEIME